MWFIGSDAFLSNTLYLLSLFRCKIEHIIFRSCSSWPHPSSFKTPHSIRLLHLLLPLIPLIYRSHCHSLHSLKMDSWPSGFSCILAPISFWGMVEFSHFLHLASNPFSSASPHDSYPWSPHQNNASEIYCKDPLFDTTWYPTIPASWPQHFLDLVETS